MCPSCQKKIKNDDDEYNKFSNRAWSSRLEVAGDPSAPLLVVKFILSPRIPKQMNLRMANAARIAMRVARVGLS